MPDNLLGAVRCLNSQYATYVFQNAESIRDIFPEKARVFIQDDTVRYFWILGDHWELYATIADIGIEDPLKTTFVTDLAVVHGADSLRDRQNLRKLQVRESC